MTERMPEYLVPDWCGMPDWYGMPSDEHDDDMGQCWAIWRGYVADKGISYCYTCQYYKPNLEKHNTATTPYSK